MRTCKSEAERRIDITVRLPRWFKFAMQKYATEKNITMTKLIENSLKKEMDQTNLTNKSLNKSK